MQGKAKTAVSGRTANHDSHCSNGRSVVLLPHHETLQHNSTQQSKSAKGNKHRDIETSGACSMNVYLSKVTVLRDILHHSCMQSKVQEKGRSAWNTATGEEMTLTHKTTDHVQDINQGQG